MTFHMVSLKNSRGGYMTGYQDFFTSLFDLYYGKKKWYWGLSTAARHYGIEWSATKILEIIVQQKSKTINVSDKILSLQKKKSYRSATLAKYLSSLDINLIYIHKGDKESLSSIKIDEAIGPVCTKEQIQKDIKKFVSKIRNHNLRKIYKRSI